MGHHQLRSVVPLLLPAGGHLVANSVPGGEVPGLFLLTGGDPGPCPCGLSRRSSGSSRSWHWQTILASQRMNCVRCRPSWRSIMPRSSARGATTSEVEVEVLGLTPHALWLWVRGREYMLDYAR